MCTNKKKNADLEPKFPSLLTYIRNDYERERFKAYQERLVKERRLDDVWRWYSNDFFSFDLDLYAVELDKLIPDKMDEFAECCDTLKAPIILKDIFDYIERKYGFEYLLILLDKFPICVKNDNKAEFIWNQNSFAAPIIVDYVYEKFSCKEFIDENNDIRKRCVAVGEKLSKREDGCFLVWNYVKYLLTKNKNQEFTFFFINCLTEVFCPVFNKKYEKEDWKKKLRPKGFSLKNNRLRFSETGLLGVTNKDSMCLNMLTQMQFYNKSKINEYIPYFEDAILLEDEAFKVISKRPQLCHLCIADIYLAADSPLEAWKSTWMKMGPARYRIIFNRYDDFSMSLERNINFLFLIGVSMMEKLYSITDKEKFNIGKEMCEMLLCYLTDIINSRGKRVSLLNQEMFDYLVTWKFLYEKAESGDVIASCRIVDYILNRHLTPRRLLELLLLLKANGFLLNVINKEKKSDVFYERVMLVVNFAIKQEKSEYKLAELGRYIKNWLTSSMRSDK